MIVKYKRAKDEQEYQVGLVESIVITVDRHNSTMDLIVYYKNQIGFLSVGLVKSIQIEDRIKDHWNEDNNL